MIPIFNSDQKTPLMMCPPDFFHSVGQLMQIIVSQQNHLMESIQELRADFQEHQREQKMMANDAKPENSSESEELTFRRDKVCRVDGCGKKYSSRISLRAHIRKKHSLDTLKEEKNWHRHR